MQNIVWKVVLILFVLAICLWSVFPVKQKIRLGKDLRGGTSLIYLVNLPDNTPNKQEVIAQTIEVLKERVNPSGVLDISMSPLGEDRIEIVMPLPNDEIKALRKTYDAALDSLLKLAAIHPNDLDDALKSNKAVEQFGGASGRGSQIETLQSTYNAFEAAKKAMAEGRASGGVEGPALIALEQAVVDARIAYENARQALLKTSLDEARVVRTLNLPDKQEPLKDAQNKVILDANGKPTMGEGQRTLALKALKAEFPHLADRLDKAVAAFDTYQSQRTTLDDPEDLMRLLRGAGVLEFRIAVQSNNPEGVNIADLRRQLQEVGPGKTDSTVARWFPINDLKQWYKTPEQLQYMESDPQSYFTGRGLVADRLEGQLYLLLYNTPAKSMTHTADSKWTVESAGTTADELGRTAVSFRLDESGGQKMSRLTGPHVQQPMAIVLDGQVYTAPNLNSAIAKSGIIQGDFTPTDIQYLIRVLAAGALEARLSDQPIAVNTLGPSLGRDNLQRGQTAFILSVVVTVVIMLGYYFFAGLIANIALLINAVLIFGTMAMIDGTFTLPGIAGIALSIAMAVDANVLIYERIREEMVNNKEDLRTAIRLGYSRAMNAIIDGNVTHLITCVVLLYTATTEVKGFALTMILGVLATLFTALFVTRVLFTFYTEAFHARTLPMLPTVFPGIHKSLEPSINWLAKRKIFFGGSIALSIVCLVLVFSRGSQMLDTEFRGGLAITMQTRLATGSEPKDSEGRLVLRRPEVESEIKSIGEKAGEANPALHQLRNASVLTVGESTADFGSSRFQVKVASPPTVDSDQTITDVIVDAIVKEFGDRLDVVPAHTFVGAGVADHRAHTYPIEDDILGININRPQHTESVAKFRGGVAIVLDDLSPAVSEESVATRVKSFREKPEFAAARGRSVEVVGLTPVDANDAGRGFTSVAVLVYDDNLDQSEVEVELWDKQLAENEWKLVSTALATGSSLQEVNSFSPAMARTLAANAVVAVVLSLLGMLVYIWIRFGSLRYSVSTIVAVTHNVIVCLGALALTQYLAGTPIASFLMLEEFRIDLNVIAALLTIIGYSLNDTIVILDRIRENRGKRLFATPEIINNSINQTFSRTILTGGSTILASIILYVLGGTGIQPFAFTFLVGLLIGTYSSVAIAAPLVADRSGGTGDGAGSVHPPRLPGKPAELAASA